MEQRFQVDLGGIIDLLSQHIYSGPHVFLRELLQNGVDAVTARKGRTADFAGSVRVTVAPGSTSLTFEDDGIGLTVEEIHRFLSTIGDSAKRGALLDPGADFIGRFGVGLLSCFMVTDRIVATTRSAVADDAPTLRWTGLRDGTYTLETVTEEEALSAPGTRVELRPKPGAEEWFALYRVRQLLTAFGRFLSVPVWVGEAELHERINERPAPWQRQLSGRAELTAAIFELGRELFGMEFLDFVPLHSKAGAVDGVALVLPRELNPTARQDHRCYLRGMLVTERADNLLPEWAFFVRAVVSAKDLRPAASRETIYEDDTLAQAREELGECLRGWLVGLAQRDPERMSRLLQVHFMSFKALAAFDDEFFDVIIDSLPFETSLGQLTMGEYRRRFHKVLYTRSVDEFRQLAPIATAQGTCVVNAGYAYDVTLLERLAERDVEVIAVDATSITDGLEDLSLEERELAQELVETAERELAELGCAVLIRKFAPEGVPALYSLDGESAYHRDVSRTRDNSSELWRGLLDELVSTQAAPTATLCFNYRNPVVRQLLGLHDPDLLGTLVQVLYVHTLMLSRRPLGGQELELLNRGLMTLVESHLSLHRRVLQ